MPREKALLVRVTTEEHQKVRVAAAQAGLSMEAYVRRLVLGTGLPPNTGYAVQRGTDGSPNRMAWTPPATIGNVKRIRDEHGNRL